MQYRNIMEGLCPSIPLCVYLLPGTSLSQHDSCLRTRSSHTVIWNLYRSLTTLRQGLTPISSHTTIPHLHWQFLPNQTIADWGFPLGRGGDRQAPWKHPPIVHYLACRCINEPLPQIPGLPSASLLMYQSKVISGVSGKMLGVFIPALNISRNPLQKIRFPNGFC